MEARTNSGGGTPLGLRGRASNAGLQALPADLLAAIAGLLGPQPHDRLRLAASSRTLLAAARQQSPSWWEQVEVSAVGTRAVRRVAAWLAASRPRTQKLVLALGGWGESSNQYALPTPPLPDLVDLSILRTTPCLLSILALTQLTWLHLPEDQGLLLPSQASALCLLRQLSMRPGPAGQSGLQHLPAACPLTSLELHRLWDTALPPALSTLSALLHLKVSGYQDDEEHIVGWQHLPTSLTALDISHTSEWCAPPELSRLTRLQALEVGDFLNLERSLPHLAGLLLASFRVRESEISGFPAALSTLSTLVDLEIVKHQNYDGCIEGGLEHLGGLGRLTGLELGSVGCPLPAAFSGLTALRSLGLDFTHGIGQSYTDSLCHLSSCRFLTWLHVGCYDDGFQELPPLLAQLTELCSLGLAGLSERALDTCHVPLAQLTELSLQACEQLQLKALAGLASLVSLTLQSSVVEGGWHGLGPLRRLTSMDFKYCTLRGDDDQAAIASLPTLRTLSLHQCKLAATHDRPHLPFTAPGLVSLSIDDCEAASLPPELHGMSALENSSLQPHCVSYSYHHRTSLTLSSSRIAALLAEAGGFSTLQQLSVIEYEQLGTAAATWQPLERLRGLTALELESWGLHSVPAAVSALTTLRKVKVGFAQNSAGGWRHLAGLPFLAELELNCKLYIPMLPRELTSRPWLYIH